MLKRLEDIALSNTDIMHLLDHKANIVLYPNLHKYKNIDQVLGPHEATVILFEFKPEYGHWVCIWKLDKQTLSFFNSYGGYPDDSLLYIDGSFRDKSNQEYPYLSELFVNSPYKLTYNEFEFQKHKKDIKTCGRHCVVRLYCRNLDDKEYYDFIEAYKRELGVTADELVTLLTPLNK
jgi:hypothetical protein